MGRLDPQAQRMMLNLLKRDAREKGRSILPSIPVPGGCSKYDMLEFRESIGQLCRLIFAVFARRIFSNCLKRNDIGGVLPNGLGNQFSSDRPVPMFAFAKI